jgi:AraC-like DNA-binding protein
VRRTRSDQIFVNLQLRGHCIASQGGRTCLVPAGSFALFDTTSEYVLEFFEDAKVQEWRALSFRVPRANLLPLLAEPTNSTAIVHDGRVGGCGNIVASTMASIWGSLDSLSRAEADGAEIAFSTILAAAVGGKDRAREYDRESIDRALRASINRYLAAHLRTGHDLSAPSVARRFNVSVRKLHGLYTDSDFTFAKTLMKLRVEGCARELASAEQVRSLTDVATRWGFCDLSHLNRVFRVHYGCSPADYRSCKSPELN